MTQLTTQHQSCLQTRENRRASILGKEVLSSSLVTTFARKAYSKAASSMQGFSGEGREELPRHARLLSYSEGPMRYEKDFIQTTRDESMYFR